VTVDTHTLSSRGIPRRRRSRCVSLRDYFLRDILMDVTREDVTINEVGHTPCCTSLQEAGAVIHN